jgi:hypothetical protein
LNITCQGIVLGIRALWILYGSNQQALRNRQKHRFKNW